VFVARVAVGKPVKLEGLDFRWTQGNGGRGTGFPSGEVVGKLV
jgi:hypothetical protein